MGGKHGHRRSLADCAMRSYIVVVLAPKFDLLLGIVKVQEPMLVQAFKAYPGVEALDEGVVRRFTGSTEVQNNAVRIGPQIEFARGELAAIVDPYTAWLTEHGNCPIEHRHDVGCSGLMPSPERGAHPGEVVDQGQNPEPPSIEKLIVHPIHRPTVIGCNSRHTVVSKFGHDPAPGRFVAHLQAFQPVKPIHPGSACGPPSRCSRIWIRRYPYRTRVSAISRILLRNKACSGRLDLYRYIDRCNASTRQARLVPIWKQVRNMVHKLPFLRRPQTFFLRTSCSISLSRLKSDTSRRSRAFSSSKCFSLRTSEGISPP